MNYIAKIKADKKNRSESSAIRCTKEEDMCRPEWAKDADINTIIARAMNGQQIASRPATFGHYDDTFDMTKAIEAADRLATAYERMPKEFRDTVTPREFQERVRRGDQMNMFEETKPEEKPKEEKLAETVKTP